jgi:hypothetical protein
LGERAFERARGLHRERQGGEPPEGEIGFRIGRVGIVARDPEQHRRHAERQRDLARGGVAGFGKVHVRGREAHRLPVEPAFKKQRTPGILSPRMGAGEFRTQTIELLVAQSLGARGKDQRAGRPRGIVDQCLVPCPAGIVQVDGGRRRLHR